MTNCMVAALVLALIAFGISVKSCMDLREEKDRLSDNQRSLFSEIEFYRTKDSRSVASVEKPTLTKKELEQYSVELTQTIKDLDIKINRLESAGSAAVKTEVSITTPVTEDTLMMELNPIPVQRFDWRDDWVSVSGIIRNGQG